jgi:excisionase family DNA binding protein
MKIENSVSIRLTVNQVAKRLNVHSGSVYRWTLKGVRGRRLPSFLIGGRRYIAIADLEKFLSPAAQSVSNVDSQRTKLAQERLRSFGVNVQPQEDGAA